MPKYAGGRKPVGRRPWTPRAVSRRGAPRNSRQSANKSSPPPKIRGDDRNLRVLPQNIAGCSALRNFLKFFIICTSSSSASVHCPLILGDFNNKFAGSARARLLDRKSLPVNGCPLLLTSMVPEIFDEAIIISKPESYAYLVIFCFYHHRIVRAQISLVARMDAK